MMTSKSKRDYLKKYLTDDKKSHKKKMKKSKNNEQKRIKIIDDNVNIINNNENCIDDLILTGEDAPQIVGIIDERPHELKVLENFQSDGKWKSIPRSNMNADNNKFRNESINRKQQTDRDSIDDLSPKRKETHSDSSPKQRSYRDSSDDMSPKRKRTSADSSPKQRSYRDSSDDMSPKRKRTNADSSPKRQSHRRSRDLEDLSPDRRRNKTLKRQGSNQSSISLERIALQERKTLDGKSAGLQHAKSLKQESENFRKQENELFMNMSNSISGKDAEIAVRNSSIKHRKERKNLNKNPEEKRKKMKLEKQKQDVYSRWGKGLKQIEDYKNKIAEEQYEMNKPLARYSNDADLDEILKKQERDGDPMLEYIRKKDKNKNPKERIIPIYRGSFPENRFNIRPGYRWDGVNRSNEYEKRWFEAQNRRKVLQQEAYKYSTEDM